MARKTTEPTPEETAEDATTEVEETGEVVGIVGDLDDREPEAADVTKVDVNQLIDDEVFCRNMFRLAEQQEVYWREERVKAARNLAIAQSALREGRFMAGRPE